MSLKEQARKLARDIESDRLEAEKASVFNMKPILERMAERQSRFNKIVIEVLCNG